MNKINNTYKLLLIGNDFSFSTKEGINRYSYELYTGLKGKGIELEFMEEPIIKGKYIKKAISTYMPLFMQENLKEYDLAHFMYPTVYKTKLNKKTKEIVTFHDNLMYDRAQVYSYLSKDYLRWKIAQKLMEDRLKEVDAVICDSSASLNMLKHICKIKNRDIPQTYIVNLGISDKFINAKPYEGKRKDYVYIGSIHFPHKNLAKLIEYFAMLQNFNDTDKLHIFTGSVNAKELIEAQIKRQDEPEIVRNGIILHYKATDEEMLGILSKARALLHLTKKEGFGLPILEAQAIGTPVITLDNAIIPEEVSRYTINVIDMVDDSGKILDAQISREAIDYAKSFTWDKCIKETMKIYNKVLGD